MWSRLIARLGIICILFVLAVPLYGLGEKPSFDDTQPRPSVVPQNPSSGDSGRPSNVVPSPESSPQTSIPSGSSDPFSRVGSDAQSTPALLPTLDDNDTTLDLNEEERFELERDYTKAMKQKEFGQALSFLDQIPTRYLDKTKRWEKRFLLLFRQIENELSESSSLFQSEDELDEETKRSIRKLYREAQQALIDRDNHLSRDLLIQTLFIHRRNFKAKKLLEYGHGLGTGAYKVENMEAKYWNQSRIHFYGGNYEKAVRDLQVLSFFDKENPLVYERMGSAYYMLGDAKRAVGSWNTALFLDPDNQKLSEIVKRAEDVIKEDEAQARELLKKKKRPKVEKKKVKTQLMGVFPNQQQAYNFAAALKDEGIKPIVEEMDNGKWSVRVPVEEKSDEGK